MKVKRINEDTTSTVRIKSHLFNMDDGQYLAKLDLTNDEFDLLRMSYVNYDLFDDKLPRGSYGSVKTNDDNPYKNVYITKGSSLLSMIKDLPRIWETDDVDGIMEDFKNTIKYLEKDPDSYYVFWNHYSTNISDAQSVIDVINNYLN